MRNSVNRLLAATLMALAVSLSVGAQNPLHKKVNYSIDTEFELRMGDYILPAGKYVLFQIDLDNPNLFGLYRGDLTKEPVALIKTVRKTYPTGDFPDKTKIKLVMDEENPRRETVQVLKGWTVPGTDGYEIVGVVEKSKGLLIRAH